MHLIFMHNEILANLMTEEIIDKFMFELIDLSLADKIIDFIFKKLKNLGILVDRNDIQISEESSLIIKTSKNLKKELKKFEYCNPEYFI